jgi:rare lipoprotein A
MRGLTAAHRTLPLGTLAQVTNPENGKSVRVKINDRGPFVANRFLDLSYGAAKEIGTVEKGVAWVRLEAWPQERELSSRRFTVQVGAFLIEQNAKRLREKMESYGPSSISVYQTNRQKFYRVRVGDFREEGQAAALSKKLMKEGFSPFTVCAN